MVVDTGAVVSVLPDYLYFEQFQESALQFKSSKMTLKTYTGTGENINVLGEFQARVNTKDGEQKLLPIVVIQSVSTNQPVLMGRN